MLLDLYSSFWTGDGLGPSTPATTYTEDATGASDYVCDTTDVDFLLLADGSRLLMADGTPLLLTGDATAFADDATPATVYSDEVF